MSGDGDEGGVQGLHADPRITATREGAPLVSRGGQLARYVQTPNRLSSLLRYTFTDRPTPVGITGIGTGA